MSAIAVEQLTKEYTARVKAEGLGASFRALVRPEYRTVCAVRDVSFAVGQGEILAFIGPNGAGKSTTIKMLTGILHPSGGHMDVLGLNPSRDRKRLAYRIGSVFGQKSQLWFHLPPTDSFALLGAIYDVPKETLHRRIAELTERFELGDLLTTPVRKLSLGQRVRCEVAASLLHEPELIFLDEPTIGLDVVVKQRIRELILELNREKGTTIFFTSHDMGDVEQVCRRALVIDQGRILLDKPVSALRNEYLHTKVIAVRFHTDQALPDWDGVAAQRAEGFAWQLTVDTRRIPIAVVMQGLTATGNIEDITVSDPPMEDVIADIFKRQVSA